MISDICKEGDDCGFFKLDEEVEISIMTRSTILKQKIEKLVYEIKKMKNELGNLRVTKQGKNTGDDDNSTDSWKLREEVSI